MIHTSTKIMSLASVLLLTACGGSSSSDTPESPEPQPQPTSTSFSLAVSDAPIDDAIAVVVYFDEVELMGNGDPVSFTVTGEDDGPRSIDLLSVQGTDFATLVTDEEIPLGEYTQLRVSVTEESYIEMEQGTFPLVVPSNELKLDGFTAMANVTAAYTLEFDLRKSLVDPVGQPVIFLKPRGVRLVANTEVGVVEGTVAESLVLDESCANKEDPLKGNAVYLYQGTDLSLEVLGDDADQPTDENEVSPYAIAEVTYDEEAQVYQYQAGYVDAGDYTLAFTCQAALDMPESDEGTEDGFTFLLEQEAAVVAEQTTEVHFP